MTIRTGRVGDRIGGEAILVFGGASDERYVSIASAVWLSRHHEFDEAFCIERDGSVRSYLNMQLQEHPADFRSELNARWSHAGATIENWIKALRRQRPTCFLALHGGEGEDGTLQAALEAAGLPFTGSGSSASRIAFDKVVARTVATAQGLCVAPGAEYEPAAVDTVRQQFGSMPVIVKPCVGGSSLGLSLHDDIESALRHLAATPQPRMLIEGFIRGRELSCGVIERPGGGVEALSPVEIERTRSIFDYEEKYGGGAKEICPAPLAADETRRVQEQALHIHRALGCRGYSRSDFIYADDGRLVYLETNTLPGLGEKSLLPLSLAVTGIPLAQFIQEQIALVQPETTLVELPTRAPEPPRSRLRQQDPLYAAAVGLVLDARRASASFVQRTLRLGFDRASRLVERMEHEGLVAAPGPGGNRELLVATAEEKQAVLSRLGVALGPPEHRNVEIKAMVADLSPLEARLAKQTGGEARVLSQRDFFFHCPTGRLKLRFEADYGTTSEQAHLIHYSRGDQDGARLSRYSITPVAEPDGLLDVLAAAYGLVGQVSKIRRLFLVGRTRVHLDLVNGLGYFVELEVLLGEGETIEEGEREAYELMTALGIPRENCLAGAYLNYWPLNPDRASALQLPVLVAG